MAQTYAGILGLLALLTSLGHGFIHARETEAILLTAWLSLLVFAPVGYLVGWIACRTVEESVRVQKYFLPVKLSMLMSATGPK